MSSPARGACAQCRELLRHVHAKNAEIAKLKDELGDLALFKAKKQREMRERIAARSPSPRHDRCSASAVPPASTPRASEGRSASSRRASVAAVTEVPRDDARHLAILLERNTHIAAERDVAKADLADALKRIAELEKRLHHIPGVTRAGSPARAAGSRTASPAPLTRSASAGSPDRGVDVRQGASTAASGSSPYVAFDETSAPESRVPSHAVTPRGHSRSAQRLRADAVEPQSSQTPAVRRSASAAPSCRYAELRGRYLHAVVAATPKAKLAAVIAGSSPMARQPSQSAPRARGGEWLSPNLALLSEEPEMGVRSHFSRRAKPVDLPRVASLSPAHQQRSGYVAAALGWQAEHVAPSGTVIRTLRPRDLAPRDLPGPTLSSPRAAHGRSASVPPEVAAAVAALRDRVGRADREMYLAMHDVEHRADPLSPFKVAFEAVKQTVASHSDSVDPALPSAVADVALWPVDETSLGKIPAAMASHLAHNLKRLIASYDYLSADAGKRTQMALSLTVREFELNAEVLASIAALPQVVALLQ